MKRLLTLAAIFLCCMANSFAQFSGSGSGTESDPYVILNPIQLNQLRNFLNQSGVYFKLMADIDLTEFLEDENPDQGWQPVGTTSAPFKGILDGNGKTISGFWISRPNSDNVGFIGYSEGCEINNLKLKGSEVCGHDQVGFLVGDGYNYTIKNCVLEGNVKGNSKVGGCSGCRGTLYNIESNVNVSGRDYTGGLIGYDGYSVYNSIVKCEYVEGSNYVGGIYGSTDGAVIDNNQVHALVSGTDYIGGIVGQYINNESIGLSSSSSGKMYLPLHCCNFYGDVNGRSYVGGLCGELSGFNEVKGCSFIGNVFSSGNYVGGLVGYSTYYIKSTHIYCAIIIQSYACGSVIGKEMVGGLVGYKKRGTIKNCYSNATVSGTAVVGGLCGKVEEYSELSSNVAITNSVKATEGKVGRIYGERGNNVTIGTMGTAQENKTYNRAIVISKGVAQEITDNEMNGTGVSATTLKLKATYVAMDWDFTDTWEIQETECYPYFKTQTAPPVITSQVVSGATIISGKCVDSGTVTLEIDGVKQEKNSMGHEFSFTISPLQEGHEVRVSAKADGKEQSYFTTEVVSFLGKGTEADPYQISTAADLTQVYRKGYYKLMNDIDLTSYINQFSPSEGWQSIGRDGSETIYFDGNNHKVTGLWCNSTRDNTGLFSCFANGYIKNLTVETDNSKQVKGGANTGIMIGKMINGTIENCRVAGSLSDGTPVGGIVGLMDNGIISKCQSSITINTTGSTSYVGGLVGEITAGQIDQCSTTGALTATGTESYVGGLVGKNSSTITNCYSDAVISSSYNAAGLVAYNYSVVDRCCASGNLYSNNYAAGVIGYNDGENAAVKNCAAMNNKIDVVYESQQVQQGGGYGQRIIGGIKNGAPAPEMNNYALKTMQMSVNNVAQKVYDDIMNGSAKTETELKSKRVYQTLGWNFENVWKIDEGTGYPYLTIASIVTPSNPTNPDPSGGGNNEDDTGISGNKSSSLAISDASALVGCTFNLPVSMKNEDEITAMQFELSLPEGVSVASAALTDRKDGHSIDFSQLANGNYQFTVFSSSSKAIKGTEGDVANISLSISSSMAAGSYTIQAKNIELTTTAGNAIHQADLSATLTISNIKLGDVNGDTKITITDAVGIVNYILGNTSANFHAEAADVNSDGSISITDAVRVVNIILNQGSGVKERRTLEQETEREPQ